MICNNLSLRATHYQNTKNENKVFHTIDVFDDFCQCSDS
jgi:hypothetical protein